MINEPYSMEKLPTFAYHYFLDEAGDATFYGKGRVPILGQDGVSNCFIMGLLKVHEPLNAVRKKIVDLQNQIAQDPYYEKIPSILKKKSANGYYLHAKDDLPEVRKTAFELIRSIDCNKALTHAKFHSPERAQKCKVVFNVQKPTIEPILNLADYFCWSIQRVFEKGETRFYDYVSNKISVVWDLYDFAGAVSRQNYYSRNRKLTEANCINEKSPKMH